ncbi:MAG: LysR family transcriptional regulator [Gammaproteobacteria bacterium]|nr:LysR family transcriptional regulator [Gammaproteobacteria bacterium]MCP5136483.1 LysR family transcriptional regulator [Gammaproteobacteria bacterium]
MELSGLRTFVSVVEHGGVLAAAAHLHTVPSNVSARLKRLEVELGVPLFLRQGRRMHLTPGGAVLEEHARHLLLMERQAMQAVREAGDGTGELRLGANETFVALNLPDLLTAMRQQHPGVEVRLALANSQQLIRDVLEHRLDCAFVGGPVTHADLEAEEIYRDELMCVEALDGGGNERLVAFPEGCAYRARAEAWMRSAGKPATEPLVLNTLDGVLGCVAAGLGFTLMPRDAVMRSAHRDALRLSALPAATAVVPVLLVRRRDGVPLAAMRTVKRLAKAVT